MNDEEFDQPTRKRGRPRKGDNPIVDYNELDKLLVHGELGPTEDGKGVATVFPSYRQLGERFGVAFSIVSDYAKKHNCLARRERARLRTQLRVEEKMVEAHAEAISVSKERSVQIIDCYLLGFEKAISDGRVRFDNPTDYNTMARLKEFLMGGADSRQEVHAALSLDTLQARHKETRRALAESGPAERGVVEEGSSARGKSEATRGAPLAATQSAPSGEGSR